MPRPLYAGLFHRFRWYRTSPWLFPLQASRMSTLSCASGSAPCPPADQSFSASHVGKDGRRFRFATVVVRSMKEGDSALGAWAHACSLIGTASPTLAVVFISKPTKSALRAVQELAGQLSSVDPNSGTVSQKLDTNSGCKSSGTVGAPVDNSLIDKAGSAEIAPFIGCVSEGLVDEFGDDWQSIRQLHDTKSEKALQSEGENSSSTLGSMVGRDPDCRAAELKKRTNTPAPQVEASGRQSDAFLGFKYEGTRGGASVSQAHCMSDFERAQGTCQTALRTSGKQKADLGFEAPVRALSGKEDTEIEDEGSISDWEEVFVEYADMKGEDICTQEGQENGEVDGRDVGDHVEVDITVGSEKGSEVSRQGLMGSLNDLPESSLKHAMNTILQPPARQNATDKVLPMDNDPHGGTEIAAAIPGEEEGLERQTVVGGREVTIPLKDMIQAPEITSGNRGITGSTLGKDEDEEFTLVLCMGHLPGARAVGFVSPTTGLPYLPDMERAVTVNNPHIVMLGAPGFEFPEFNRRLSTVFPKSCRAGAFLAPLFSSTRNQSSKLAEQKTGPLFYGLQNTMKGVVGLAVSSEEGAGEVPVDAFAQFVQMSLGMPCIPGFIFLDEEVSKSLFLPRNVVLDKRPESEKRNPQTIISILDQLRSYLLRASPTPDARLMQSISEDMGVDGKESNGTALSTQVPVNGEQSEHQEQLKNKPAMPSPRSREGKQSKMPSQLAGGGRIGGKVPLVGDQSRNLERLPLGFFDAVLFPGWSMPFHIYEPCYRMMVRQCLEQGKPFGLSSMCATSWNSSDVDTEEIIGTVANLKVYMFERDCRSFIIAHGIRRFRLTDKRISVQPGSFGLNMGQVEYFDDEPCGTGVDKATVLKLAKQAVEMCCIVVPEAQTAPGLVGSIHDPMLASFAVGHLLEVPNRVKRRWLGMVSTKRRLMEQLQFLEAQTRL